MANVRVLGLTASGSLVEIPDADVALLPKSAVNGSETSIDIGGTTFTGVFAVHSEGTGNAIVSQYHRHSNDATGVYLVALKSRGTTAAPVIVQDGDDLIGQYALAFDGVDYAIASRIISVVDGTPASNVIPSKLLFSVANDAGTLTDVIALMKSKAAIFQGTAVFLAEFNNGNSGVADTIDWNAGQKQKSTLTGAPPCVLTFTAPAGPCNVILKLIQGGSGSQTVTWPATVKWPGGTAPTLSTAAGAIDLISLYYDGTNYYSGAMLDMK